MKGVRGSAVVLLAFLGLSAIAGAVPMLMHPDGGGVFPPSLLAHTPFRSFLVPGIILLTANGLLALAVLWMLLRRVPGHALAVRAQGCVLLGWIVIECILLRVVMWLQVAYGLLGVALIVLGALLRGSESTERR
jgi:hypothetical protein